MKRVVIIRPAAEADLREAKGWYDGQRPGLGKEFLMAADDAMRVLEERAERSPIYYRNFRRVILRRFPFKIFYLVESDRVVVFRVLHTKRDHTRNL